MEDEFSRPHATAALLVEANSFFIEGDAESEQQQDDVLASGYWNLLGFGFACLFWGGWRGSF